MNTGAARRPIIDMEAYELNLKSRMDPTANILRGINARARNNQARMIFAEGDDPRVLRAVHVPMLRGTLLTAVLLVFVDVLKELPATLILRPFNFNTLAVRAYELASDERLADASSAALAIVVTGIIPVILLSRSIAVDRK